jgi:hypothetical protein
MESIGVEESLQEKLQVTIKEEEERFFCRSMLRLSRSIPRRIGWHIRTLKGLGLQNLSAQGRSLPI